MADPMRFMAVLDDGSVLKSSNEPAEVQGAAEKHMEEGGKAVHLYQHVFSMEARDGD